MEVEDVAGVGFTSRRTTEQQGHLAIGHSLLGQVVVHDEGVLAVVAVIFGHGATGVGRDILQRGRLGSGSRNDGGVLHGTMLAQGVGHERDSGAFLPDSHIEAVHVGILLGKDGVDADGGLAGLTVADDQFALPAADGGHGVDGLDPGNHGFVHALTGDDAGSFHFHGAEFGGFNRSETVDGHTEGVQNAPHDGIADRHGEDAAGTFDRIAFFNAGIFTKQGYTHVVFFQVEHHAQQSAGELEKLHGHGVLHAIYTGDPVPYGKHCAGFGGIDTLLVVLDLLFDDLADLACIDMHDPIHPS